MNREYRQILLHISREMKMTKNKQMYVLTLKSTIFVKKFTG